MCVCVRVLCLFIYLFIQTVHCLIEFQENIKILTVSTDNIFHQDNLVNLTRTLLCNTIKSQCILSTISTSKNGGFPVAISITVHPRDQMSA